MKKIWLIIKREYLTRVKKSIYTSLSELQKGTEVIASGNLNYRIPVIN